ncbi:SEC14-like protein 2 [Uloborus diversus]|uniref:SEC14-like protein 2 n=1 Tax=Uloborus diversus TaxID=327109 RepID=UPI002409C693|nr:SEC14-like protein 2 [Uloborus diversus]
MDTPENVADLLKQFRENVFDILTPDHTDAILLKWLRARNYNLKKAEYNFREVDSNKTIFGVKTMLETYVKPEVAEKYERTCLIGIAKDGTPIRYVSFGLDYQGFIMSLTGYEQCLYFSYCMELDLATARKENEKTGKNDQNEVTYIFDMEDFALQDYMHKCVMESGMDFFRLLQDHYPEVWKHILIINAPGYFHRAFNLLKPIFRATLLEKIQVVSKNQTGELLRKYIDDDVLPSFLGGKRVDSKGDPKCGEVFPIMNHPYCKIPQEFYVNNRKPLLSLKEPGVQSVTIGARSVYNVPVVVKKACTKVSFRYRSEGGSLGIRILYRENE